MSSDSALSLVPLSTLPDATKKPASSILALVGPVSPAIGAPLFAFSEVDHGGYNVSTLGRRASPLQHWMKAFKPALAIGLVFGGLVGSLVLLVQRRMDSLPAVIGLIAGLTLLFTFLFRPKRQGFSAVVGSDGLDVGVVDGSSLSKVVVRYEDDDYLFFEYGTNIYTRRAGHPKPATPTNVEMVLFLRDRASLELRATMKSVWHFRDPMEGRAPAHRAGVYFALVEHGYPRRIERAAARLQRGEPVDLPIVDGRTLRILPAPGVAGMPWAVELLRGGACELRVAELALREGQYRLAGDGRSARIGREQVGDAFVLDALVIAPTGAAMSPVGDSAD
ncbi:hypothetical protein OV090_38020 [Nannocystis sp. RBIL2]|uniref:hypothetical protein n=1 Tax=Nannocystis sp. RBIL2 TaxID=2996788 RepID=UPI002270D907|nr:hypothetical protein [Nannocystis sp. RBIL2]MCY1070601.1 hypothetical protein [Nannocystis sp. RBIL2]